MPTAAAAVGDEEPDDDPVEELLRRIDRGDESARDEIFKLLYADLHVRARRAMRFAPRTGTLRATMLVNEAYLRLRHGAWENRDHFLVAASQAMRHVMIDYIRQRPHTRSIDAAMEQIVQDFEHHSGDLSALHAALERLEVDDPEMGRAVVLRFWGGLPMEEIARMLEMKLRTFERRWQETRQRLYREMQ